MIFDEISAALQAGNANKTKALVQQALEQNVPVQDILSKGLLAGMDIIGDKFKNNQVFIPEVLISARAMNQSIELLKPYFEANGIQTIGRVCLGTVRGDIHDIGKNLVKIMLESKGFEVIDLGTDVAPESFVRCAIDQNCSIICCSALLTTTRGVMAEVVNARNEAGMKDTIKIMVGGAAVSEDFCNEIGADCYTPDATSAAQAAVAFVR